MPFGFASARLRRWSPRLAINILLNNMVSRGAIACARCACHAFWLRLCAAAPLVATVGHQDF